MAAGLSILQTLAGLGQDTARARTLRDEEALARQQLIEQLATSKQNRGLNERRVAVEETYARLAGQHPAGTPRFQRVTFTTPAGETIDGSYNPLTGEYLDQDNKPVKGARPATPSSSLPKRIQYIGADGKPRFGFQVGGKLYDDQMQELPPGTEPYQRGLIGTESDSTTVDPFGNVSHTTTLRKPTYDAGTGAPTGKGGTAKPKGSTSSPAATADSLARGLDAQGHIPATAGNPQVVEAANQLLDGTDKDKLPTKVRELASALARRYGWEQGRFTPKEQVLLREATTFLRQAQNDKALAALDGDFTDRLALMQLVRSPDKDGFIGRGLTAATAMNVSPKNAAFVRMYNQLVGTISGLSQLVRSGRATEASIERLKLELPNPATTRNSADARARIQRLLNEVSTAMRKGSFTGDDSATPNVEGEVIINGRKIPLGGR